MTSLMSTLHLAVAILAVHHQLAWASQTFPSSTPGVIEGEIVKSASWSSDASTASPSASSIFLSEEVDDTKHQVEQAPLGRQEAPCNSRTLSAALDRSRATARVLRISIGRFIGAFALWSRPFDAARRWTQLAVDRRISSNYMSSCAIVQRRCFGLRA